MACSSTPLGLQVPISVLLYVRVSDGRGVPPSLGFLLLQSRRQPSPAFSPLPEGEWKSPTLTWMATATYSMRGCCAMDGKSCFKGLQGLLVNISIYLLLHFQRRVGTDGANFACGCSYYEGILGSWAHKMLLWGCVLIALFLAVLRLVYF